MSIRIARFTAQNAKGFSEFDRELGDVNIFSGRNGQGKTSFTDLLLATFSTDKATNDRQLLKVGAEEGFIQVVMRNDETGETWTVRRDLKPGKVSPPKIRSSKSGPVRAYGAFLEGIADLVSMDPFRRAMSASPKEQAEILLRTMPLRTTVEELRAAAPGWVSREIEQACAAGGNAIDLIDSLHDAIYEERTGINSVVKEKRGAVAEWEATLDKSEGADPTADLTLLRKQQTETSSRIASIQSRADVALGEEKQRLQGNYAQAKSDLEAEAQRKIDGIKTQLARDIDAIAITKDEAIEQATTKARVLAGQHTADLNATLQSLATRIGEAEEKARAAERAAAQKTLIERTRVEAEAKEQESKGLTAALKRLDDLKVQLLEQLPIKALKIQKGRAYLDGVPLEEVNRAQAGLFWIRVAVQRAIEQDLGVVVLDDAEKFDDINFPKIVQAAKASGVQFFIGRQEPHEFRVDVL